MIHYRYNKWKENIFTIKWTRLLPWHNKNRISLSIVQIMFISQTRVIILIHLYSNGEIPVAWDNFEWWEKWCIPISIWKEGRRGRGGMGGWGGLVRLLPHPFVTLPRWPSCKWSNWNLLAQVGAPAQYSPYQESCHLVDTWDFNFDVLGIRAFFGEGEGGYCGGDSHFIEQWWYTS